MPRDLYNELLKAAYDYLDRGTPRGRAALIYVLEDVAQPLDSGVRKYLAYYFKTIGTKGGRRSKDRDYLIYADEAHALRRSGVPLYQIASRAAKSLTKKLKRRVTSRMVRDAIERHADYFDGLDRSRANPIKFDRAGNIIKS